MEITAKKVKRFTALIPSQNRQNRIMLRVIVLCPDTISIFFKALIFSMTVAIENEGPGSHRFSPANFSTKLLN